VTTDWGPAVSGVTSPTVFDQFDPHLGTLDAVLITLTTTIRNDYIMTFPGSAPNQPPTTLYLATSATSDPSVLTDPAKRALLTDGPTITLYASDGVTQIFGPPGTRQPVDFVQKTDAVAETFSSLLPVTDPHFIPPTMTQQSFSRTLDPSNAPGSLLASFIGKGKVDLPITAIAFGSFYSDSGNGSGILLTKARGTVTVQYLYTSTQASVPEPSSAILLPVGIGGCFLAYRLRRRAARLAHGDGA
jgi:hypothetical protein